MSVLAWLAWLVATFMLAGFFWIALGFALHFADHVQRKSSDRPPLSAYLRAFFVEYWWSFVTWVLYPVGLLPPRPIRWDPQGGPPIVLVHGFMMNHASMIPVRRSLRRQGYRNVLMVNVRPLRRELEVQAARLAALIRELSKACGDQAVIGIGHSQGGVLLRLCAQLEPPVPLAKIITLGSPHRGTKVAAFSLAPNARQMRWNSPFLASAAEPCRVELVSIYSDLDNIVFPATTSAIGRPILLPGLGHHVVLFDKGALELVRRELPPLSD